MLEDEVKDLRLCLRSADKELAESKAELVREQKASSKRSSELYQQVSNWVHYYLYCTYRTVDC